VPRNTKLTIGKASAISAVVVLMFVPLLAPEIEYLLTIIFALAILAASWDVLYGYAGEISLGHVFPFGVAAFTAGLLSRLPEGLAILGGAAAATGINLAVAGAALRIRGPHFAILTLATTLIADRVAVAIWGEEGIYSIPPLLGGSVDAGYYAGLLLLSASVSLMFLICRSRLGLKLTAMREDWLAASVSGIDVFRYKIAAFAISSFFAGIAGGFYALFIGHVNHSVFSIGNSFAVLSTAVFGGLGTIIGPVIGAFILQFISLYFVSLAAYNLIIYGAVLAFFLLVSPGGLMGLLVGLRRRKGESQVAPSD